MNVSGETGTSSSISEGIFDIVASAEWLSVPRQIQADIDSDGHFYALHFSTLTGGKIGPARTWTGQGQSSQHFRDAGAVPPAL